MINKNYITQEKYTDLSDEEIVLKVKSGDYEYFNEIVKRYNQRLYRIALSYGVFNDDCEEVLQRAYISAFEKIDQFRGEAKFSTWLSKILINECLMLKRKNKKFIKINDSEYVTIPSGDHLNPESYYMEKEKKEIIENAIKQLPEKYKSVFILKEVEGMSIEETSEVLEITKVNVKVRLHRARFMLKKILQEVSDMSSLFTFGNERCDRVNSAVMNYIKQKSA